MFYTEETFRLDVDSEEYMHDLTDYSIALKVNYLATVTETKQSFASQDDFRLRTLVPDVKTVSISYRLTSIEIVISLRVVDLNQKFVME